MLKIMVNLLMYMIMLALVSCNVNTNVTTDENTNVEIENIKEENMQQEESIANEINSDFQKIYEYNRAIIYYNPQLTLSDKGDLKFDIRIDATNCLDNIAIKLDNCMVNGFDIITQSKIMVNSGNEIDTTMTIGTSAMAKYGINNYVDIKTGFIIYTFNPETYDINKDPVAKINSVNFTPINTNSDTKPTNLDNLIFDNNGVKIYSNISEDIIYSVLNLYIVNDSKNNVTLLPCNLEINDEKNNTDYSEYVFTVNSNSKSFTILPLPNYTYDEVTYKTTKFDVDDYKISFVIQ